MSETDKDFNQTYDAEQMTEEISSGDRPAPNVDVSADYEASKELSVSAIDQSEEGAKAAEAVSSHQLEVPETGDIKAESTSDPSDYKAMAKEVNPISGNEK
ncbi:hypothetical protein [Myxacorys almedinensis]|uniref:Uncharacterized protein n=1 Tax=Myxacorys almedinensis A TaxID=2690445 RepID=A0A8J7YX41_9CYAN|nr:hypothetical protein [Myxacorys almedinensis]NDJ15774.1 hypothetical protein [Myxacorys almedinensis A]